MAKNWYLKEIAQERTATGEKFQLITNVPCHLWMRWSLIPPKTHRISVKRRGIIIRTDLYFCFDVYEDNEQLEPSDTLIHTFLKEPWPYCQERWYYYHGNIDGKPSKSTSAIFYKHPTPPPTTTKRYPPMTTFGWAYRAWNNWATARNYPTASVTGNWATEGMSALDWNALYHIIRGAIYFDTTTLPNQLILAATLCIPTRAVSHIYGGGLVWQPSTIYLLNAPDLHYPITKPDYGYLLSCNQDFWHRKYNTWGEIYIATIDLPPSTLLTIKPGGITSFGVREEHDLTNQPPPWRQLFAVQPCNTQIGIGTPYLDVIFKT